MRDMNMTATEQSTDRLVTDLKRIVQDSEALLHATKDAVGDKAHEVRERLTDALASAKHTCRGLEDKAIEGAKAADQSRPSVSIHRCRVWRRPAHRRARHQKVIAHERSH